MELKNAAAVCLISLFSAMLAVLIARSLDSQAAARLEPQLISIAEELKALRAQGGIAAASGGAAQLDAVSDGWIVYYFHSNARCPTCRAIESQSHEAVQTKFAPQLADGRMVWKIVNYEQPAAADLVEKFEIQVPVVVAAKIKGGEIGAWKRLDQVWALNDDKPAFIKYVQDEIQQMIDQDKDENAAAPASVNGPEKGPPAIPIPE